MGYLPLSNLFSQYSLPRDLVTQFASSSKYRSQIHSFNFCVFFVTVLQGNCPLLSVLLTWGQFSYIFIESVR